MKPWAFYGGAGLIAAGAGLPLVLPSLPSSIQSGPLQSVGTFIINNQNWMVLIGLLLMLGSLFL